MGEVTRRSFDWRQYLFVHRYLLGQLVLILEHRIDLGLLFLYGLDQPPCIHVALRLAAGHAPFTLPVAGFVGLTVLKLVLGLVLRKFADVAASAPNSRQLVGNAPATVQRSLVDRVHVAAVLLDKLLVAFFHQLRAVSRFRWSRDSKRIRVFGLSVERV